MPPGLAFTAYTWRPSATSFYLLDLSICTLHQVLLKLDWELDVLILTQIHWDQLQLWTAITLREMHMRKTGEGGRNMQANKHVPLYKSTQPSRTSVELSDLALGQQPKKVEALELMLAL